MQRTTAGILAAAALVATMSVALAAPQAEIGKAAPDFTLKDHSGKVVTLSELKGKIVVLEWFNAGCPYVQLHHSKKTTMKDLANKYAEKGVVWLAICSNAGSSVDQNAGSAKQLKVEYGILDDASGQVGKAYGAKATPHMFVIDTQGVLRYAGAIDNDPNNNKANATNYVAKAIDEILAGTEVTTPKTNPYGCGIKYAN